ncbi:hypothetical protein SASPL_112761 [Salvia splendens]|uniref:Retrotransposon gag domain-containing protein n=1 Tax=Salvia splendens TaxID=180675 RepID=A0A8X8YBC3_SALSN|nr:hypothetical protein SASPL_112761 [Salvia splendens]
MAKKLHELMQLWMSPKKERRGRRRHEADPRTDGPRKIDQREQLLGPPSIGTSKDRSWEDFLLDIKRRFDPDLYEDYVGRLAALQQTGSLDDYLGEFVPILAKVSNVGDDTLTSLFIEGLVPSLKHELLTRRPSSLTDAMALAQQLDAFRPISATTAVTPSKPQWQRRHLRPQAAASAGGPKSDSEEEETNADNLSDDGANMTITGDVSRILVIGPKIKLRSIRLTGYIRDSPLSVLIDGGSTHNLIKPSVADKLCLPLHVISPFRVFSGMELLSGVITAGCSTGCSMASGLRRRHKELQDSTDELESGPVCLQGEDGPPHQISYNGLFSLIGQKPESQVFELVHVDRST